MYDQETAASRGKNTHFLQLKFGCMTQMIRAIRNVKKAPLSWAWGLSLDDMSHTVSLLYQNGTNFIPVCILSNHSEHFCQIWIGLEPEKLVCNWNRKNNRLSSGCQILQVACIVYCSLLMTYLLLTLVPLKCSTNSLDSTKVLWLCS